MVRRFSTYGSLSSRFGSSGTSRFGIGRVGRTGTSPVRGAPGCSISRSILRCSDSLRFGARLLRGARGAGGAGGAGVNSLGVSGASTDGGRATTVLLRAPRGLGELPLSNLSAMPRKPCSRRPAPLSCGFKRPKILLSRRAIRSPLRTSSTFSNR